MTIELQILGSLLRAVAEEMGAVLVRSAFSANIKERRDCSTGLFDERGRMIAQAEHIPVHLGAMPDAVAAVISYEHEDGLSNVLKDPNAAGPHLPDNTDAELVARMRNPDERRGDLRAQLAAHRLAERRIAELCARRGRDRVVAAMDELYDYSERRMRAGVAALPDGRYEAQDVLEAIDGELELRAAVTIAGETVAIDFAGTSPQHDGNLNCPLSVARSACFYVVRVLVDPDLPASGGAFAPVTVTAPEGCLLNARPPAAVAAGNVETSSRIVDVVMRAFGEAIDVPAQGQGTMNNVTLGNDDFTYYETIGGGQGACPNADGPSGVHVAMSNTLSTPIEALELQYPLRVERYELRLGSGGAGQQRGGDGVLRELRALEDCRLSVISERRASAPQGERGGAPGSPGWNRLNGHPLPAKATVDLAAGDVVTIETPGGGGFGR